jgi:hypothetical protein
MTTLTPIHLHALARLATLYGEAAVRDALAVATAYGNFNARATERILGRACAFRPKPNTQSGP